MMKKNQEKWAIKKLLRSYFNGEIDFKYNFRGEGWCDERKNLLIHSIIHDYPIQSMCLSQENYSRLFVIDGHERIKTITSFTNSEWKLSKNFIFTDAKGKKHNFSNLVHSKLPYAIQKKIMNYSILINFLLNFQENQIREIYERLNNRKA